MVGGPLKRGYAGNERKESKSTGIFSRKKDQGARRVGKSNGGGKCKSEMGWDAR